MTYGLLSALCWGISTLLAAMAARRIGALRTVAIGEAVALAGYWILFMTGHFSLHGAGPVAWLLILAGVIGVGGYLAMYRGLESGHVGLVSAISACYGGVIAVLSVVLLHERLTVAATIEERWHLRPLGPRDAAATSLATAFAANAPTTHG